MAYTSLGCTLVFGQMIDKIVAKVDNYIVLKSELEVAYLQFLQSQESKFAPDKSKIKCTILESLVINKLLLAKAELDSVTVDKSAVESQLDRRMQYFVSQFGSEKKLEDYYKKSVDDLKADLRRQVRDQMITEKMQGQITSGLKITPGEVEKFYKAIPKDSLPYFSTEVEVGQIVRTAEISKEQRALFLGKAEDIRQRLIQGEDFCTLAKRYSEDPGSAKQCGELGFFKKGDLVKPYESMAYKLQPGETSEVVESEFGYHIIQLIERRGAEYNTRHILIKPGSSLRDLSHAENFLDSLRTMILRDSITFEKAAKEYSIEKTTKNNGGMFLDESGSSRIPMEKIDPGVFFVIDTIQVGGISRPVRFRTEDNQEAVRIIYYKTKIPAHQANLKDDYQKIHNATMDEQKNTAINKWFDKTKGEVYIDIEPDYDSCNLLKKE
ncbi:MAG: surA [Chitinophagaceae bacterium]|nr:surA [Chitinophagaceae bacterium]